MPKNKKEDINKVVDETNPTAQESTQEAKIEDTKAAEDLNAQIDELKESKLRIIAEYDNFRKRSAKEKESIYSDAEMATAAKFLPVLDNLERAAKQDSSDEAYKKGVEMTLSQMYIVMEKMSIKEIPSIGEQFNPELHNAVLHVEDEAIDENTIIEVFEKGFTIGDRVLRHAVVKVAN